MHGVDVFYQYFMKWFILPTRVFVAYHANYPIINCEIWEQSCQNLVLFVEEFNVNRKRIVDENRLVY